MFLLKAKPSGDSLPMTQHQEVSSMLWSFQVGALNCTTASFATMTSKKPRNRDGETALSILYTDSSVAGAQPGSGHGSTSCGRWPRLTGNAFPSPKSSNSSRPQVISLATGMAFTPARHCGFFTSSKNPTRSMARTSSSNRSSGKSKRVKIAGAIFPGSSVGQGHHLRFR